MCNRHLAEFAGRGADTTDETNQADEEQSGRRKLCVPVAVNEVIADVDAFFSGKPPESRGLKNWNSAIAVEGYFSLLPHDAMKKGCHCLKCKALWNRDNPKGLVSDLVWGYVARIGEAMKDKHPGKRVVCLAYNKYRAPPAGVTLPDNVIPAPTALHMCSERKGRAG